MPRRARPKIKKASPKTLQLTQEVQKISRQLRESLPPAHGNTQLQDWDILTALLCAFFEPDVRSLRLIDQLSEVPGVQDSLDVDRLAKSTLSDGLARFRIEYLRPIVKTLRRRLPGLAREDQTLVALTEQIIAGDGSTFHMAGEVLWAMQRTKDASGKKASEVKLHLQVDVRRWTMEEMRVTGARNGSEQAAMKQMLASGVIYLLDRGYCGFDLVRAILEADSHFVLRLKKDNGFQVQQDHPLSQKDQEAGVLADQVGLLGKSDEQLSPASQRKTPPPLQLLRRIQVWDPKNLKVVVLITDLLEEEAWMIAYLYRCRWIVELFLRWMKVTAGMAHLLSESPRGVELQFYVAMIGTLLIHLHTGLPVSKYSLFALGQVAGGRATYKQMLPGLLRRERERMLEKLRLARKKAAAKNKP